MTDLATMEIVLKDHLEFTRSTFPLATSRGALLHAVREIEEAIADIDTRAPRERLVMEFADILGCVFDAMDRENIMSLEVALAMMQKVVINKQRQWKYNGDGSYSHIKSAPFL